VKSRRDGWIRKYGRRARQAFRRFLKRGELAAAAAADPDDNGRDVAFSLALEDEGTGALHSFGGCDGGLYAVLRVEGAEEDDLYRSVQRYH
jgi:hypothetical protein